MVMDFLDETNRNGVMGGPAGQGGYRAPGPARAPAPVQPAAQAAPPYPAYDPSFDASRAPAGGSYPDRAPGSGGFTEIDPANYGIAPDGRGTPLEDVTVVGRPAPNPRRSRSPWSNPSGGRLRLPS